MVVNISAVSTVTIQQPVSIGNTGFAGIGSTTIAIATATISNGTVNAITVGVNLELDILLLNLLQF